MMFKYCPECAGVDIRALKSGGQECNRCGFIGTMSSGAMDEINTIKKKLGNKPVIKRVRTEGQEHTDLSPNQLKEKLQALKGKKTDEVEFL